MGRWEEYYLIESLNLNTPIKVTANNRMTWQAMFKVGDIDYRFAADLSSYDEDWEDIAEHPAEWGITFWNMTKHTVLTAGHTDITGDAGTSSLKVFSGVASAFKQFIKAKKPDSFFFTADEPSRVRLYNRLAKIISQKLNYKLDSQKGFDDTVYQFTK